MNRIEIKSAAKQQLSANYGIILGANVLFAIIIGIASTVASFASIILTGPLTFGIVSIMIGSVRNENPPFETLFNGFKYFGTTFCTGLLVSIFTTLWTLLFIIPGIVKSYSYAMTFYILKDNPNIKATEAIDLSQKMMKGHKADLFVLHLSFIGWLILSIFTFGILNILYVTPYMQLSTANFYEKLKAENAVAEPVTEVLE